MRRQGDKGCGPRGAACNNANVQRKARCHFDQREKSFSDPDLQDSQR
jgi:hypothetical protein